MLLKILLSFCFFVGLHGQSRSSGWQPALRSENKLIGKITGARNCMGFKFDENHVVSTSTCLKSSSDVYFNNIRLDPIYFHKMWKASSPSDFNLAIAKFAIKPRLAPLVTQKSVHNNDQMVSYRFSRGRLVRCMFVVVPRRTCDRIYFTLQPNAARTKRNRGMHLCARPARGSRNDVMGSAALGAPPHRPFGSIPGRCRLQLHWRA
ncbi:hypothetical protein DSO57_1018952 [Entomophthora muscae]|uniref:Uncharacterized protein n=1 Tax=Entomophthora muscae TaxID=34485 RepID=A0ACC2STC1_9FUNG|nr:hypothetical protein DSO57_1018952 [Entomophthora muscae]